MKRALAGRTEGETELRESLSGKKKSRMEKIHDHRTLFVVRAVMFDGAKFTNTLSARGRRLPADCFIAIKTVFWKPSLDESYYLFPVVMQNGSAVIGEGFRRSEKGTPIMRDCLARPFAFGEFQEFILSHEFAHEEILVTAVKLRKLLLRRRERTVMRCGCVGKEHVSVPKGRLTWTSQTPMGMCESCDQPFHQACHSCNCPFDENGGEFDAVPLQYYSERKREWRECRSAKTEHYSSALDCSDRLGIRQGIIRSIRYGSSRDLEGRIVEEGEEKAVRVILRVTRTKRQKEGSCACVSGRKRVGY